MGKKSREKGRSEGGRRERKGGRKGGYFGIHHNKSFFIFSLSSFPSAYLRRDVCIFTLFLSLCVHLDAGGRTTSLQESGVNFFSFFKTGLLSFDWLG